MNLTAEEFHKQTGMRFRVTQKQRAAIKAGTLTRDEAFQQAVDAGVIELRMNHASRTNDSWKDTTLTIDNFQEKTGRRFRLDSGRAKLVRDKALTREEAFEQTVEEKRNGIQ